jgi:hypothetical protein
VAFRRSRRRQRTQESRFRIQGGGRGARTFSTPGPPRGFYFFFAAFFLVAFFLAVFFRAFFLAGIEEIPPFSPQIGQRGPLQHVGSQRASHTSGRVGSPPIPVKWFSVNGFPPCCTGGGSYAVEDGVKTALICSWSPFQRINHAKILWCRVFHRGSRPGSSSGRDDRLLYTT